MLLVLQFQTKGVNFLLVWLFLINIACFSLLPVLGFLYSNDEYGLYGSTELTLLLIAYTLAYSVLTLYTTCLVSKFGCCFIEGKETELSNRTGHSGSHDLQVKL